MFTDEAATPWINPPAPNGVTENGPWTKPCLFLFLVGSGSLVRDEESGLHTATALTAWVDAAP